MVNNYYQAIQGQIPDISKNAYLQNATLQDAIKNIGGAFVGLAQNQRDQNTNGLLSQIVSAQDPNQLQNLHPAIQQQLAQMGQGVDQLGVLNAFSKQQASLNQQAQAQADRDMQLGNISDQDKAYSAYAQGGTNGVKTAMANGAFNNSANAVMAYKMGVDNDNNLFDQAIKSRAQDNADTTSAINNTAKAVEIGKTLAQGRLGEDGNPTEPVTQVINGKVYTTQPTSNGAAMGAGNGLLNSLLTAALGGKSRGQQGQAQSNQPDNSYNSQYQNKDWLEGTSPTDMSLGDLRDAQRDMVNATRNPNTGLGTSPMGRYGIVGTTLENTAKQLYGKNWQSQQFTPQVQDQLAEQIYNSGRNGNMTKIFEGLNNVPGANKVGAFKNIPFSQVKDMIARYESGYNGGFTNPLNGSSSLPNPSDSGSVTSPASSNLQNAVAKPNQTVPSNAYKVDAKNLEGARNSLAAYTDNVNLDSAFNSANSNTDLNNRTMNDWLVQNGYAKGEADMSDYAMGGDNVRKVDAYNNIKNNPQFMKLSPKDKQSVLTSVANGSNAYAKAPVGSGVINFFNAAGKTLSNWAGKNGYSAEQANSKANTLISDIIQQKKKDAVEADFKNFTKLGMELVGKNPGLPLDQALQAISPSKYQELIKYHGNGKSGTANPFAK